MIENLNFSIRQVWQAQGGGSWVSQQWFFQLDFLKFSDLTAHKTHFFCLHVCKDRADEKEIRLNEQPWTLSQLSHHRCNLLAGSSTLSVSKGSNFNFNQYDIDNGGQIGPKNFAWLSRSLIQVVMGHLFDSSRHISGVLFGHSFVPTGHKDRLQGS